ncbi:MAG: hypothetical protein AAB229_01590 [Candidatus Hydrogenedentota bacterium]
MTASCQISSLSLPHWDVYLLHRPAPQGSHQLLECLEFPDRNHMIFLASSISSAQGAQSLDFLRGLIASLGMKVKGLERMQQALLQHLRNLIPDGNLPAILILDIPAGDSDVCWSSSDPGRFIHAPSRQNVPPPRSPLTFLTSDDPMLIQEIRPLLTNTETKFSIVDAMESIRDLLESSGRLSTSISLVHLNRTR